MNRLISFIEEIGKIYIFLSLILKTAFRKKIKTEEVFNQIWRISFDSVPTTLMAGFFVGAIMTIQFSMQLLEFGAMGYLGGLATSGTIREVGPLLIAFMLSGKVGAFTSAELGTMRVTEQIDAVRCLGADPIQEIVIPRFVGIIISSFILLAGGLLMSVLGGMFLGELFAGINYQEYVRHIPTIVSPISVVSGLVKCGFFAFILALICTYKGFYAEGGAKGVGRAVVQTSVITMSAIVVVDWMTSFIGSSILSVLEGIYL